MNPLRFQQIIKSLVPHLALGLFLLQDIARADVTTLHLVSASLDSTTLGGVFTSPYLFNNDPNSTSGAFLALACDDFATEIYFGDWWQANELTLKNVANPPPFPKFGPPTVTDPNGNTIAGVPKDPTDAQAYDAAAFLAEQILYPTSSNPMDPSLASYAIWQIFDANAITGRLNGTQQSIVYGYLASAFAPNNDKINPNYDVTIYTPTTGDNDRGAVSSGCLEAGAPVSSSCQVAVTQEFIGINSNLQSQNYVPSPEVSTTSFLAFDFMAVPALVFFVCRRFRKNA